MEKEFGQRKLQALSLAQTIQKKKLCGITPFGAFISLEPPVCALTGYMKIQYDLFCWYCYFPRETESFED